MRADRLLIGAVLSLGAGTWILLAPCHGTAGLGLAFPISDTKFNVAITTMGAPVLLGVPLTLLGLVLLLVAFVAAIAAQFKPAPRPHREDVLPSRQTPV